MKEEEKSLTVVNPGQDLTEYKSDLSSMMQLVRSEMRPAHDYGTIPGTGNKKVLFDPGAEKLAKFFGLAPDYILVEEIKDFEKGFFYFKYKCSLTHIKSGKTVGSATRSCNSFERKYLYSYKKRNTPEELVGNMNTYEAMAQKRAFVEAVKTATMASELFVSGERDDKAPGKPVNKQEDPVRVKLMGKLFATAKDRGFSSEFIKASLKSKYKVESLTEVTNKQISLAIEELEKRFNVVSAGAKPSPMKNESSTPETPPTNDVEEGEIVEEEPETVEDEERTCYECRTKMKRSEAFKDWFCKEKCQVAWTEKNYPKKSASALEKKLNELKNKQSK